MSDVPNSEPPQQDGANNGNVDPAFAEAYGLLVLSISKLVLIKTFEGLEDPSFKDQEFALDFVDLTLRAISSSLRRNKSSFNASHKLAHLRCMNAISQALKSLKAIRLREISSTLSSTLLQAAIGSLDGARLVIESIGNRVQLRAALKNSREADKVAKNKVIEAAPKPLRGASAVRRPLLALNDLSYARLAHLELKEFRCFEELFVNFDLTSNKTLPGLWNCVAGVNGAGKSSILQSIALCIVGMPNSLELGANYLQRAIKLDGHQHRPSSILNLTMQPAEGPTETRGVRLIGGAKFGATNLKESARFSGASPLVLGYGANRSLSDYVDTRHDGKSAAVRRVISLFDPLASLASAGLLLRNRRDLPEASPLLAKLLEAVLPGEFEVYFDEFSEKLIFNAGGAVIPATELPDGFRSSAAWMADLCTQWVEWCHSVGREVSGDLSEIHAIVLIDEIDLHLHPSLQRTIVPSLRKALPLVQWVVTTHSPLILGSFDAREIIALDSKAPGHVRVLDRQILGFSTDEIYEWLMGTDPRGRSLSDLLGGKLTAKQESEIAQILMTTPDTSAAEAKQKLSEMRSILAKLKKAKS